MKIEACNNALDDSPAWEDVTESYKQNKAHSFTNTTKTASNWAVNYRFTVTRGTATGKSYIKAFGLSFG